MKNSFAIGKSYIDIIDKKEIIIVDDVISTGSTVNEMAKILKQN
jgi:predicted amidophosphoribosyltransferase